MALTINKTTQSLKVTGTTAAAEAVYDGQIWIERIYWQNPTTDAHLVNITDTDGNPIAAFNCVTDNIGKPQERVLRAPYSGIKIDDMDSGTIWIQLGSGR